MQRRNRVLHDKLGTRTTWKSKKNNTKGKNGPTAMRVFLDSISDPSANQIQPTQIFGGKQGRCKKTLNRMRTPLKCRHNLTRIHIITYLHARAKSNLQTTELIKLKGRDDK